MSLDNVLTLLLVIFAALSYITIIIIIKRNSIPHRPKFRMLFL